MGKVFEVLTFGKGGHWRVGNRARGESESPYSVKYARRGGTLLCVRYLFENPASQRRLVAGEDTLTYASIPQCLAIRMVLV